LASGCRLQLLGQLPGDNISEKRIWADRTTKNPMRAVLFASCGSRERERVILMHMALEKRCY